MPFARGPAWPLLDASAVLASCIFIVGTPVLGGTLGRR
jgi:hypothetical protein